MRRLVVLVVLLGGCPVDPTVVCGELRCPADTVCIPGGCATLDQIAACSGIADGESCTIAAFESAVCKDGACQQVLCGDQRMLGPEVCDDGNQRSGDGCSADCLSSETCGNDYVDTLADEECDSGLFGLAGDGCSSVCSLEVAMWSNVSPRAIVKRHSHRAAYDPTRKRLVVYGGFDENLNPIGDTWEWDGSTWRELHPSISPGPRSRHALVFDKARGVTLLFGGLGEVGIEDETWTWDGVQWNQLQPATVPPGRISAVVAYDPVRQQVVMYGGAGLSDTWLWNGVDWTQHFGAVHPATGGELAMAWDDDGKRVLLVRVSGATSQTWSWNGSVWSQVLVASPTNASDPMLSEIAGHNLLRCGAQNSTWIWSAGAWTQVTPPASPTPRFEPALSYNSDTSEIFLVGGWNAGTDLNDLWKYSGATWLQVPVVVQPAKVVGSALAYMPTLGAHVLFGGADAALNATDETWVFDGSAWSLKNLVTRPPARREAGMVTVRDHVLLFGGSPGDFAVIGDTWEYDGAVWTRRMPATVPPPRHGHMMAYDRARDRVLMYGGRTYNPNTAILDDTWEWDGTDWHLLSPAHTPGARTAGMIAYDDRRQRIVLFGGATASGVHGGDTWEWDGSDWISMSPVTSPPGRQLGYAAYHGGRHTVMMFGGTSAAVYDDLWEWNGTEWQERSAVTSTHYRFGHAMTYDPIRQALIVAGGSMGLAASPDLASFGFTSASHPRDQCIDVDTDGDTLVGCADPDCWGRCTPLCPPGQTCDPSAPHCGDTKCIPPLEDSYLCPADCG